MSRALEGVRVAVLRASGGGELVSALEDRGASAVIVRVGEIEDRPDADVVAGAGDVARFAWVAVTSVNAARRLSVLSSRLAAGTSIGAVGPASASAVRALGLRCDVVAPHGTARSLGAVIDTGPVLFLAASDARSDLADALGARGISTTTVVAYDVVPRELDDDDVDALVACDVIVAMSPLAADALASVPPEIAVAVRSVPLVAIGPTTDQHARDTGWMVAARAAARDPDAVCDAVRAAAHHVAH